MGDEMVVGRERCYDIRSLAVSLNDACTGQGRCAIRVEGDTLRDLEALARKLEDTQERKMLGGSSEDAGDVSMGEQRVGDGCPRRFGLGKLPREEADEWSDGDHHRTAAGLQSGESNSSRKRLGKTRAHCVKMRESE